MTRRRQKGASAVRGEDFPTLREFFSGYLHQDFVEVHGSLTAAAGAFVADASPHERGELVRELRAFVAATNTLPTARLGTVVSRELGGAWQPASLEELAALLTVLTPPD